MTATQPTTGPTLNPLYNAAFARWQAEPIACEPNCEHCSSDMTGRAVVQGQFGWYCSDRCRGREENSGAKVVSDREARAEERRQLGLGDF